MNPKSSPQEPEQISSQQDRDKIVLEHLYLVKAVAASVHKTLPAHIDLDDLVHAGVLGLLDAVARYDLKKGLSFRTYAKHRIRGAILDELRQLDWASRDLRTKQKRINKAASDLTAVLGRFPSEFEIAKNLDLEIGALRKTQSTLQSISLISMTPASSECKDRTETLVGDPQWRPDRISETRERRTALAQAMETLPAHYRRVVQMHYVKDMSSKSISAEIGVKESRISQLYSTALKKMLVALRSKGIHSSAAI